jgi:putative NIF3 family GTP cyclohydrolase 1 type 2
MGRIVRFKERQPLSALVSRMSRALGNPKAFSIAIPQSATVDGISVSSVGICAGSGGSLLTPLNDVDLLFTGELSHHEALSAIERGQTVITLFHSNSERGFLHSVLRGQLKVKVEEEWSSMRRDEGESRAVGSPLTEALEDISVNVDVSERDRDPFGILVA